MLDDDDDQWCPHCRDFRPVDEDGTCARCGNDVDDESAEVGDDESERFCESCGDYRPVDDDGCCMRCGEETAS